MAVNETQNLGEELRQGITDGSVKKGNPDRRVDTDMEQHASVFGLQEQYGYKTWGTAAHDEIANLVHDGRRFGPPPAPLHIDYDITV